MKNFFQLFYLNPLLVLAFSSWLIYLSFLYIEFNLTERKELDTYEVCKSFDGKEFISCFKENNVAYLKYERCELAKGRSLTAELNWCEETLAVDDTARSIMNDPASFKRYVFNPNTFCDNNAERPDEEFFKEDYVAESFINQYVICVKELDSSGYVFTTVKDVFSITNLLIYLVMTLPVLALAIYWIKRNKPFITEVNLKETFSWLSDTKKFRINIVGTLAWLIAFYIVGVVTGEYRSLNPIEEREISLWIIYFVSLYPLTVLLISNYIYSADEK